jgi:hypothetical protein
MQTLQTSRGLAFGVAVAFAMALSGCEAVKFVFEAGVWVGVIAVVIVLAVAAFLVRTLRS